MRDVLNENIRASRTGIWNDHVGIIVNDQENVSVSKKRKRVESIATVQKKRKLELVLGTRVDQYCMTDSCMFENKDKGVQVGSGIGQMENLLNYYVTLYKSSQLDEQANYELLDKVRELEEKLEKVEFERQQLMRLSLGFHQKDERIAELEFNNEILKQQIEELKKENITTSPQTNSP